MILTAGEGRLPAGAQHCHSTWPRAGYRAAPAGGSGSAKPNYNLLLYIELQSWIQYGAYNRTYCSRSDPNEGGKPAISAYWADYTQVQLSEMMATVPHCHRQPIFIEQSEAILAELQSWIQYGAYTQDILFSLFLVQPYEGGRPAVSAYWADYTQAQLGAMMATVPHSHRQPIFLEQSKAILAELQSWIQYGAYTQDILFSLFLVQP